MERSRQEKLAIIHRALERTGLAPSALARRAGISDTTLTRFLGGQTQTIRDTTINRIAAEAGIDTLNVTGMEEGDAAPFEGPPPMPSAPRVGDAFTLVMQSDCLSAEGIEPGDILEFDRSIAARPGDIVCAQEIDARLGVAKTLVRLFKDPYLLTHGRTVEAPVIVNKVDVTVVAPLVRMYREKTFLRAS